MWARSGGRLLRALSFPLATAPAGEHGDTRSPGVQDMCLSLQGGSGPADTVHSPHNTARGCYRPIGCASAITRRNQKALSLACPFLQLPSSQWPAQRTHSPRPLQRPLTQPLASPDSATGRGLAALRLGAWWLSPGVHLLSTPLPLHLEPWLLPSSAFQALSSCQLPWGLG